MPDLASNAPLLGLITAIATALIGVWVGYLSFKGNIFAAKTTAETTVDGRIRDDIWKWAQELKEEVKDLKAENKALEVECAGHQKLIAFYELDQKLNQTQGAMFAASITEQYRKHQLRTGETIAELEQRIQALQLYIEQSGEQLPALLPASTRDDRTSD